MQYRDLTEVFDPDLYLPINGKRYRIVAPSKARADELRELVLASLAGDVGEVEERAAFELLLGDALEEMVADGVPDPAITHAGRTAIFHYGANEQLALSHWQLGQLAGTLGVAELLADTQQLTEPPKPNRAARRNKRRRR